MSYGNGGDRPYRDVNGPQTLEDVIREIRRMFGGGNGGGSGSGGGGGGGPDFNFKSTGLFALGIILVIAALTSFYTVDVSEEGVVTRFGRYHKTTPSGLHFKLPFGVDKVMKIPSKVVLQEEFGFRSTGDRSSGASYTKQAYLEESLMLTGDLNVADVEWILQYRISDPWKFLYHARNVRKNIRDVTMSIMRRVVGDRLVGNVLTVGRVEIADKAKVLTQEVLDKYDMGITVVAVMLQDVTPPEPVTAAFNEVNAAKQEQEQAINVAEREYNKVIPEARGKAEEMIAQANAYAVESVNKAQGDAAQFRSIMREYRLAPDVTRRRMYIETMEEVMSKIDDLIIVDSKVRGVLPLFGGGQSKALSIPKAGD